MKMALVALLALVLGLTGGWYLHASWVLGTDEAASTADTAHARSNERGETGASTRPTTHIGAGVAQTCSPCEAETRDCSAQERRIADLENRISHAGDARAPKGEGNARNRYNGASAAERRVQAAQKGNMLLEFPDWRDDATLSKGLLEKYGVTNDERVSVESSYQQFSDGLRGDLQALYGDIMGDSNAGQGLALNSLIHEILRLSPQDACKNRMASMLSNLSQNQPLPPPPSDPLACEAAARTVFARVDALEQEILAALGDRGRDILWSGSSSMEFGGEKK